MKRIYLQRIDQHDTEYYLGKADPRELVKIASKIEISTPQEAQRPLNGKRVKSIASYVDVENGLLPNTLVIATNNADIKVKRAKAKDDTGNELDLFYIDFPVTDDEFEKYKESLDIMDGQHRLYSFADEFRTIKDKENYEIGFTLFVTPTLSMQRKIFMVCNEKQEKVSGNLLMWFKEKLKLLQGAELEFYPLVTQLNEENASPLKGRIIMGGERVKNGIKAQQLIRVFDKAKLQHIEVNGQQLSNDDRFNLICTYLEGWGEVCDFDLKNPDPKKDGTAYKIAGIRFMLCLLQAFWDRSLQLQKKFTTSFVKDTVKQFISSRGLQYEEFFTTEVNKPFFKSETATIEFANSCSNTIKAMDSGAFNPLA